MKLTLCILTFLMLFCIGSIPTDPSPALPSEDGCYVFLPEGYKMTQTEANYLCAHAMQHYMKDGCKEISFEVEKGIIVRTLVVDSEGRTHE